MALIDDFIPFVQPNLTGCPKTTIRTAIAQTLNAFCFATDVWSFKHDDLLLIEGIADYELDPPKDLSINRVLYAGIDGKEITGSIFNPPSFKGKPTQFLHESGKNITFNRLPDAQYWVSLKVSLVPSPAISRTTEIPDHIMTHWAEAIEQGALYRLRIMPGRAWFDGAAASHHLQQYERLKNQAKARALLQSGGNLRIKQPSFINRR